MYDTDQNSLLDRFLKEGPKIVTDLGAGLGSHTGYILDRGCDVLAVDMVLTDSLRQIASRYPDHCRLVREDITNLSFADHSTEAIWASHCLEHTLDPISVLAEWRRVLEVDGLLCVIVPPFKTEVVGRHVFTGWTVGQLMLTLFRAGFDIRQGSYARHLYNVCAIVRPSEHPLVFEPNDEMLWQYHDRFPPKIEEEIIRNKRKNTFGEIISCFEGDIDSLNW